MSVRRLLIIALLAGFLIAACRSESPSQNETGAGDVTTVESVTYVGAVEGTDAFISIVVDGDGVIAYACDGASGISEWLSGPAPATSSGGFAASNPAGARLTVNRAGTGLMGTITTADRETYRFTAEPAEGDAGIYRLDPSAQDQSGVWAAWVRNNSGEVRGSLRRTSAKERSKGARADSRTTTTTTAPTRTVEGAPALAPTVTVEGSTFPVDRVSTTTATDAVVLAPEAVTVAASFDWSMTPRYEDSWKAWGYVFPDGQIGYDPSFVHPSRYQVELDACTSNGGGQAIDEYRWTLRQDGEPLDTATSRTCLLLNSEDRPDSERLDFPAEGRYLVDLQILTSGGITARQTREVIVNDVLIVSIGDSSASGEGNPPFVFNRCHRGKTSGHSLAAQLVEDADPRTSVTFLSYACSGARLDVGLMRPYDGIEDTEGPELPPQVEQVFRGVCSVDPGDCNASDQRTVDHLLVAIGVNDIHFSEVLLGCMFDADCHRSAALEELIATGLSHIENRDPLTDTSVSDLVDQLNTYHGVGIPVLRRYLTEYPDNPFGSPSGEPSRGCGLTRGVKTPEAAWLHDQAVILNRALEAESVRRDFTYVGGIAERFSNRGYCASDTYFVAINQSFLNQGDKSGAMHPTRAGHTAIAEQVVDAMHSQLPAAPATHVTLRIESLRVHPINANAGGTTNGGSKFTDGLIGTRFVAQGAETHDGFSLDSATRVFENRIQPDVFVPLPAELMTFEFDVPAGDGLVVVGGVTGGVARETHQVSPVLSDHQFEMSGSSDTLQFDVRYRITTEPILVATSR